MLREASYALGGSQWRTVLNVVLPTARSGLATAVVLAMARGIGETAPILLTAGYAKGMNANPLHGWQTQPGDVHLQRARAPRRQRPGPHASAPPSRSWSWC